MSSNAWLVVLVLIGMVIAPAGGAYHYSVGSQDSAGVGPEETPSDPDTSQALYERGTRSSCPQPSTDVSNASNGAWQNLQGDPFCGRLVYHESTSLIQTSPPDQDLLYEDWTFDVVLTQYVGTYGLDTCYPWCGPGGVTALDALESQLQTVAPDVFEGDHEDEEDSGHQSYASDLRLPAAGLMLQREVGLAQASGWMLPTTDPTFVAFLEDDDGEPVDDQRLGDLVTGQTSTAERLPSDVIPQVCGFSPDFEGGGPSEDAPLTGSVTSACDVLFNWRGQSPETTFGPEENDRCSSAAYVCGTLTPAWYGQLACNGWVGCQPPHQMGDAWHSTHDYDVWHFVAAPALSDCNGAQEPGFRTSLTGESEAQLPYLAHDLDVYTPPTSGAHNGTVGELPEAWAQQLAGPASEGLQAETIDPARDAHETLHAAGAPPLVADGYERVHKQPIPEPNAEGDTSKSITIDREPGYCDSIGDQGEEHVDPWVNQIDTQQRYWTWNGMHANQLEPYGSREDKQDQNNRPGPGFYLTDGMLGMFADKNDDGDYEQASPEALFSDIEEVGAYPMFYDMRLNEDLEPSGGCVADFAQKPIAEAMQAAGYGPRTGLVEAVYLKEPTTLLDRRTGETYPFPDGENVFVAKSQAIKALEDVDAVIAGIIDETVEATRAPQQADIVNLHDVVPQQSDFWEQCGEPTGRYVQEMMFFHDCTVDCGDDTIATSYVFEATRADGTLGGSAIPAFQPNGEDAYSFGHGTHVWTDVDPFDNDSNRNTRDGTPQH